MPATEDPTKGEKKIQPKRKRKNPKRRAHIAKRKQPIQAGAFYTIRELSDPASPYWIASASTIFKKMREGVLIPDRMGRKVLFRGSAILALITGTTE